MSGKKVDMLEMMKRVYAEDSERSRLVKKIESMSGIITGVRVCAFILEQPEEKHLNLLRDVLQAMEQGVSFDKCYSIEDIRKTYVRGVILKRRHQGRGRR